MNNHIKLSFPKALIVQANINKLNSLANEYSQLKENTINQLMNSNKYIAMFYRIFGAYPLNIQEAEEEFYSTQPSIRNWDWRDERDNLTRQAKDCISSLLSLEYSIDQHILLSKDEFLSYKPFLPKDQLDKFLDNLNTNIRSWIT